LEEEEEVVEECVAGEGVVAAGKERKEEGNVCYKAGDFEGALGNECIVAVCVAACVAVCVAV